MKAFLVNPVKRSIEEFEYNGTMEQLVEHYPYDSDNSTVLSLNGKGDGILCIEPEFVTLAIFLEGEKLARKLGSWAYSCGRCEKPHYVFGTSIIVAVTKEPEKFGLKDPEVTIEELHMLIAWGSINMVSKEEADQFEETGEVPASVRNTEMPMDAKSEVAMQMELARIATKH